MMKLGVLLAGAGWMMMTAAHSDTLLMSYEEYMGRCLSTYGEDKLTKSVCESQYQAMEKKEQELMAQADIGEINSLHRGGAQSKKPEDVDLDKN